MVALPAPASVDLLALIGADTPLRRAAGTRGGEYDGPCPFCGGADRLRVQPAEGRWWCRQCAGSEHWGDAVEYVMIRDRLTYHEALSALGASSIEGAKKANYAKKAPEPETEPPPPAWRAAAAEVVDECEAALWTDAGLRARAYLTGRGIAPETAAAWRLGYNGRDRRIAGLWVRGGLLIPWELAGDVWGLKVRPARPEPGHKYVAVPSSRWPLYGADRLAGRPVAVLTEGELDCLLLWQECGDLAGVATLGAARGTLTAQAARYLVGAARILVCHDNDAPGEAAGQKLAQGTPRMSCVTVPQGKDVTEFWQAGGRLRDWLHFALARMNAGTSSFGASIVGAKEEVPPWPGDPSRCDRAGCNQGLLLPREPETGGWCQAHNNRVELLCLAWVQGWRELGEAGWQAFAREADDRELARAALALGR